MTSTELQKSESKRKLNETNCAKKEDGVTAERDLKRRDAEMLGDKGLQRVRFVVIGRDGLVQKRVHIFNFISNRGEAQDLAMSDFSFARMLEVLGVNRKIALQQQYRVLLPCNHVADVSNEQEWMNAIQDLQQWTSRLFVSETVPIVYLGPKRFIHRPESLETGKDKQESLVCCEVIHLDDEDDESHWQKVAGFFCYPVDEKKGVKLPGLSEIISHSTTMEIYDVLDGRFDMSDCKLKSIEKQLAKLTVLSLCCRVWDLCSTSHKEDNCDAEFTDLEQAYHIQCGCRPNSLTKTVATTSMRNVNILTVDSHASLEYGLGVMKRLFNDNVQSYLLHAMVPMEFNRGQLRNVFRDFGVGAKELIDELYQGLAIHEDGHVCLKKPVSSGGPERIIVVTTKEQKAAVLDAVLPWQTVGLGADANAHHDRERTSA